MPIDEVEPDPENAMGHGAEGRRGRRPADQPIEAFFGSDRDWPATMFVVVNDGLRQGIRMGRAWGTVEAHGNDLHDVYLDVCRELMSEKAGLAGYDVGRCSEGEPRFQVSQKPLPSRPAASTSQLERSISCRRLSAVQVRLHLY